MSVAQANLASLREQAKGKETLKTVSGTQVLADTNPITIQTGLKTVVHAVATCSVGTTANAAVITKPGGGAITLKGAAAGTYDWIARGF